VSWITRILRRHLGDTVLEVGAGIGNISGRLMGRRVLYMAAEKDPLHLHALRNRFLRTPNVCVRQLDPAVPAEFAPLADSFDTVLCLNVLEYLPEPEATVEALGRTLKAGGAMLVLVPQSPWLYCGIDRRLGHRRRFRLEELRQMLEAAGLRIETAHQLNKFGSLAWATYGGLLRRRSISKITLKLFDKSVWFWRRVDALLPWKGLSVIVVARKAAV
jgi:SAM-dependent methyltransferase